MSGSLRAALRLGAWAARGRPGRRHLSEAAGGSGGADGGGGGSGSREAVERLVREHPVVVFMKGSPAQPLCGFSNAVVQILRLHGVEDYRAHDVLQDPDLRQGQRAGVTSRRTAGTMGLAAPCWVLFVLLRLVSGLYPEPGAVHRKDELTGRSLWVGVLCHVAFPGS